MEKAIRNVRVTTIQCGAASEDIKKNVEANIELIYKDRDFNPDFVVLSELSTTPLFASVHDIRFFDWADTVPGWITEMFGNAARDLHTHIILPMFEKTPHMDYYNSAVVIDPYGSIIKGTLPDGNKVAAYRKTHIPASYDPTTKELRSNEKFYFKPGPGFPIFNTEKGKIGILICWDKRFTEAWRILGILGAEIIFNPMATWGSWRNETYKYELSIMAMNNQFFVIGCAKAGEENLGYPKKFLGGSYIVDPYGNIIAEGKSSEGSVTHAEFDLAEVGRARIATPIYRDRRPDLYDPLTWQSTW
jgi:beta-ureidopropionase